eukprot:m.668344 g.668344  ORF g.668344 m.668344 type:complete len:396 (-) comp22755_c0_seq16:1349-2536(-)
MYINQHTKVSVETHPTNTIMGIVEDDVGIIRDVTASDVEDVKEMARHTYGGHDWIMSEFNNWVDQSEHFPVGIEIDGSLRALEVLSLFDEGQTGWLAALRVHPLARRKGCARRLQQHLVHLAESKLRGIKKLRYTTGSWNEASLRLATACGLEQKYSWGVEFFRCSVEESSGNDDASGAGDTVENSESEKQAKVGDNVTFRHFPITKFQEIVKKEITAMVGALTQQALMTCNGRELDSCQVDRIAEFMPVTASVDDILAAEAHIASTRTRPDVFLYDWKCEDVQPTAGQRLAGKAGMHLLVADIKLSCAEEAPTAGSGDDTGVVSVSSYSHGYTRADFDGHVHVFTVATGCSDVAGSTDARYLSTLLHFLHHSRTAAAHHATSLMFFYGSCREHP